MVRTELALVAACDMPSIAPALVDLLLATARADAQAAAVLCRSERGLEPLLSVWRPALAEPVLRAALDDGVRMLRGVLARLPHVVVIPRGRWRAADAEGASFRNWNEPGDLPPEARRQA